MISYEELRLVFDMENPLTLEYFEVCDTVVESQYFEEHHILPKSIYPQHYLCAWNKVKLPLELHFRVHEILPFICISKTHTYSMVKSWNCMSQTREGLIDSKEYTRLKSLHRQSMLGENNPAYGKTISDETREKLIDYQRNRKPPTSKETREKQSISAKNRPPISESTRQLYSSGIRTRSFFGKPPSEETRKLMSINRSGEKAWNYGKSPSEETKKLRSDSLKRYISTNNISYAGANNPRAKQVIIDSIEYPTKLEVYKQFSINYNILERWLAEGKARYKCG